MPSWGGYRGPVTTSQELNDDPAFPWTGDLVVKQLDAPTVPEPPRHGENPSDCQSCAKADAEYLWVDRLWRLVPITSVPLLGAVILESRAHCTSYADMPTDVASDLGRVTGQVERAIEHSGEVGRVHVVRWGDGGAHFHQWFLPRPLGALQLRGQALMFWIEALPPLEESAMAAAHDAIATTLAAQP